MIYHSYWPIKYASQLKSSISIDLSSQLTTYVEKLINTIPRLDKSISDLNITSESRFLYYKEFLSLFSEFNKIERLKNEFATFDDNVKNMIALVDFIRNVLLHFPYFETWDQVHISRQLALDQSNGKNSTIAKFLDPKNARQSFFIRLTYKESGNRVESKIAFPLISSDQEEVYLNKILTEKEGVICILAVMNLICKKFIKESPISKLNKQLNKSSKAIDEFIKFHCLDLTSFKHRLGV